MEKNTKTVMDIKQNDADLSEIMQYPKPSALWSAMFYHSVLHNHE